MPRLANLFRNEFIALVKLCEGCFALLQIPRWFSAAMGKLPVCRGQSGEHARAAYFLR